ncbi:MAG: UDP-glucose--hexose-1-phosphate uridylyltransferase [Bacteroidota bacterium]
MMTELAQRVHRRYNILEGRWVLVSPHRSNRPWQGQRETIDVTELPKHDATCYLCPGNTRASGEQNPAYTSTYVFDNDFAALTPAPEQEAFIDDDLLMAETESGICRVICFSPDHSKTLPELSLAQLRSVVDTWQAQYEELGNHPEINYVQIFENKGAMMGCSNPHPHGQIWAQRTIPDLPATETTQMQTYFAREGTDMLGDYLEIELEQKQRLVCSNDSFVVVVPFWAVWPFETLVLPRRAMQSLASITPREKDDLADILKRLTTRYDNLFGMSFPYSAGIHQAPTDNKQHPEWRMHLHFYPPLLRSATVKKFMVGYEMLGMAQRDITAETSAAQLRALSEKHYKNQAGA